MGLGKTLQVIALLLLLRRHEVADPHLVVLLASLLGNWRAELERFSPDLRVYVAHRSAGDVDAPPAAPVDVVLTTYATLLRQAWLREREWGLVVLDEAQAIKNAQAKQTHAVKQLHSRHRLILTGTPVENSLTDLWSLFDFSNPACWAAPPTSRRSPAARPERDGQSPCAPWSAPTSCAG
nr:SNF2-related protein [Nannocystis pusilla]